MTLFAFLESFWPGNRGSSSECSQEHLEEEIQAQPHDTTQDVKETGGSKPDKEKGEGCGEEVERIQDTGAPRKSEVVKGSSAIGHNRRINSFSANRPASSKLTASQTTLPPAGETSLFAIEPQKKSPQVSFRADATKPRLQTLLGKTISKAATIPFAMSRPFPYTHVSCSCTDTSAPLGLPRRASREIEPSEEDANEERTFDPKSPRANFSLVPPENLLYCEDCQNSRCARCTTEEIQSWYCPNCLFETPSSMVRSEGNR